MLRTTEPPTHSSGGVWDPDGNGGCIPPIIVFPFPPRRPPYTPPT